MTKETKKIYRKDFAEVPLTGTALTYLSLPWRQLTSAEGNGITHSAGIVFVNDHIMAPLETTQINETKEKHTNIVASLDEWHFNCE